MKGFDRITFDPNIMGGQECIRGMRIPVSVILNLLANGKMAEEIIEEYPDLEKEDIQQALGWATKLIREKSDINKRLSSPHLYHFTKFSSLKSILQYGFRYSHIKESIPYGNWGQELCAICFCDIRFWETKEMQGKYGKNALVLRKEWGITKGISPVTYVHPNSISVGENYLSEMQTYFNAADRYPDQPFIEIHQYILSALGGGEHAKKELISYIEKISDSNLLKSHEKYVEVLYEKLAFLFDELARRDRLTRQYEEYGKILYDEREWRGIKTFDDYTYMKYGNDESLLNSFNVDAETEKGYPEMVQFLNNEEEESRRKGYLPETINLDFKDDDIIAILVEDEKSVEEIKRFIRTEQTLLHYEAVKDKIYPIDHFSEGL